MPHLTLPLTSGLPLVNLTVSVSVSRLAVLRQQGIAEPAPERIIGLIDTGASNTGLDPNLIQKLGLQVISKVLIQTPDKNPYLANQYEASLMLYHPAHSHLEANLPVVESHVGDQGFQALIGRDLLKSCLFQYDGAANTFTLCF